MVRLDGGSKQKKRHKRSVSLRRYPLWARSQSLLRVVAESGYKTQVPSVSSPLVMAAILGRSSICKRPTILMFSGLESTSPSFTSNQSLPKASRCWAYA
jgi:hypothetical protein